MVTPLNRAGCCVALLLADPGLAATSPWFGTWRLKLNDPSEKPETLIYSDAGHGAMRMESAEDRSVIVTQFDGKQAVDMGTGTGRKGSLAIKAMSPTSYTWTFFRAGKPFLRGRNELATDFKSFKEVSWFIAKPGKKMTFVYERK